MKTSLLHELSPDFSDLIESVGMRVTQERREESFDNALVELEGEEFDARVVRDRGFVSIDLSPTGQQSWRDLRKVLGFITRKDVPESVTELVVLLSEKWGEVAALMTSALDGLDEYERAESSAFIKNLFPSS